MNDSLLDVGEPNFWHDKAGKTFTARRNQYTSYTRAYDWLIEHAGPRGEAWDWAIRGDTLFVRLAAGYEHLWVLFALKFL